MSRIGLSVSDELTDGSRPYRARMSFSSLGRYGLNAITYSKVRE